jgi:hypothetical protein
LTQRRGSYDGGCADALIFLLASLGRLRSNGRPKAPVTATAKIFRRILAAISPLFCAGALTLLVSGCADTHYAADLTGTPEAKYNTYYAPYYYPYYPWYSYYGGAYYFGE